MQPQKSLFKKAILIAKKYFTQSDEKLIDLLLLLGATLSILLIVGFSFLISWYSMGMWNALYLKDLALFIHSTELFTFSIIGVLSGYLTQQYLTDTLSIRWRNWLTNQYTDKYLDHQKYLHLERTTSQIDNPAQRIQEDVKSFVDSSLKLSLDFLHSSLRIGLFISVLWVVGGALSVTVLGANLVIPGYLVWCALLFSFVGNFLTHKIGRILSELTNKEKKLEADLRKELEFIQSESENIAQTKSETWHKQKLTEKRDAIYTNSKQKINTQAKVSIFQNFYLNAAVIFPLIVSAPLVFLGKLSIAALGQVTNAFTEIQLGFSWFSTSYEKLMDYKASIQRLDELETALKNFDTPSTNEHIKTQCTDIDKNIQVNHLNITPPTSTETILRGINLTLKPGENILIKGESGLGKSTLFKVLASTWKHGDGEVTLPQSKHTFFLSQQPLLPNATLRAVLAYPEPENTYTDEVYKQALKAVGGLDKLTHQLDSQTTWSQRLSGGEKQRIAFARVLLKKPKWLFMDESTASLDSKHEQKIYELLKTELKDTTFVSIAHKSSVEPFHDRILFLHKDRKGQISLHETNQAANDTSRALCEQKNKICR